MFSGEMLLHLPALQARWILNILSINSIKLFFEPSVRAVPASVLGAIGLVLNPVQSVLKWIW